MRTSVANVNGGKMLNFQVGEAKVGLTARMESRSVPVQEVTRAEIRIAYDSGRTDVENSFLFFCNERTGKNGFVYNCFVTKIILMYYKKTTVEKPLVGSAKDSSWLRVLFSTEFCPGKNLLINYSYGTS